MRSSTAGLGLDHLSTPCAHDNASKPAPNPKAATAVELPWPARYLERRRALQDLYKLFYEQVLHGCHDQNCVTATCATSRRRRSKGPFRPYSTSTARGIAIELVSSTSPLAKLCPNVRSKHSAVLGGRIKESLQQVKKRGEARDQGPSSSQRPTKPLDEGSQEPEGLERSQSPTKNVQQSPERCSPCGSPVAVESDNEVRTKREPVKEPNDAASLGKQILSSVSIGQLLLPSIPQFWKSFLSPDREIEEHAYVCVSTNRALENQELSSMDDRDDRRRSSDQKNAVSDNEDLPNATSNRSDVGLPFNRHLWIYGNKINQTAPSEDSDKYSESLVPFDAIKPLVRPSCMPFRAGMSFILDIPTKSKQENSPLFLPSLASKLYFHRLAGDGDLVRLDAINSLGRTDNLNSPFKCTHSHKDSAIDEARTFNQLLSDHLSSFEKLVRCFAGLEGPTKSAAQQNLTYPLLPRIFASFHDMGSSSIVFAGLWHTAALIEQPQLPAEAVLQEDRMLSSSQIKHREDAALSVEDVSYVCQVIFAALIGFILAPSLEIPMTFPAVQKLRQVGHTHFPVDEQQPSSSSEVIRYVLELMDKFQDTLAIRLLKRLCAALVRRSFRASKNLHCDRAQQVRTKDCIFSVIARALTGDQLFAPRPDPGFATFAFSKLKLLSPSERPEHFNFFLYIGPIVEWLRGVLIEDWRGQEDFDRDSALAGALRLLSSIHEEHAGRNIPGEDFETKFISDGLDIVESPKRWMRQQDSSKHHILDFPFLFRPHLLVSYFRAINYATMTKAYNETMANGLMATRLNFGYDPSDGRKPGFLRLEQRLARLTEPYLTLNVRRDSILTDAFNQLWRRQKRELLRPLKVRLGYEEGEEGSDHGGVQQEFFRVAIAEALDPKYGAFQTDPVNHMSWFQPESFEPLYKFELLGLLVSLAIYNGITLPVTFPLALYKKLLGRSTTKLEDIEDGWPELAKGLRTLREWTDGDVEDVFCRSYTFSVEVFGSIKDFALERANRTEAPSQDAPMVTNANREQYIADYIDQLLTKSIAPQYDAFARGITTVIEPKSLSLFTAQALRTLIEGKAHIDTHALEKATSYEDGYSEDHSSIRQFWSIVHEWASPAPADTSSTSAEPWALEQDQIDLREAGQAKVRHLLEFVTASDRVPVGGENRLAFIVQRYGSDDERLPGSMTCFGRLLLPEYSSKEIMREKLERALEHSKGFGQA